MLERDDTSTEKT